MQGMHWTERQWIIATKARFLQLFKDIDSYSFSVGDVWRAIP